MTTSLIAISILLSLLEFPSAEEAFLNNVNPIPVHIDIEELLEDLGPIETYLPVTVAELKTFLWGYDTRIYTEESGLINLRGFKNQRYVDLVLLGNVLIHFSFKSTEMYTIEENGEDIMTQQQFHQLVNTVATALNLNVSISLNDCVVRSWGVTEGFWEASPPIEFQGIKYIDCIFSITVHPNLGKIESLNMSLPLNSPPNLTPVLNINDAVTAAKTVLLDADYHGVTLPQQLLLYEEPVLRIVDTPWVLVGISEEEDEIQPTISKDAPELQQARLYWLVPIYPNSEITTSVVRFFIDATNGHYAGKMEAFNFGELDPNIPIVTFTED